jgi:hypothetical protein
MSKHTPGKWEAHNKNNDDYIDIDSGCARICTVCLDISGICHDSKNPNDTPENEVKERWANAKLIAAAPALLEACKTALDQFKNIDAEADWVQGLARAVKEAETN